MTTKKTSVAVPEDVDALAPSPEFLTLDSGLVVRVERLRTRGMFKLLKIVTRGAGPIFAQMPLDFDDTEKFMGQLLAVVVMAIPEAEEETIEFLRFMVVPEAYDEYAKSKADQQKNVELFEELSRELDDPALTDSIAIISKIIENEAHDIQALGKQLAALVKTQFSFLGAKN